MLFVSIPRPELLKELPKEVDGVELRLDLFPKWDAADVKEILASLSCFVILTLRKTSQGGKFLGSEEERERKLLELLALKPLFMDIEYDMRKEFLEELFHNYPETKFILSYHNFECIPDNIEEIVSSMTCYPAYQYKIAVKVLSTNDALRMLLFAGKHSKTSVICMGERGEFARVLGIVRGNLINYASLGHKEQTGPGQISAADLVTIYRYPFLNEQTALYGLIGDPVVNSQGHIHHNGVFTKQNINAVYVKMLVKSEELVDFFSLAKEIGFHGLSVTMPHKEAVIPFLDAMDEKTIAIGAVNTLLFEEKKIFGTNTDGIGALDAIEKKMLVRDKRVVLVGAGGAARAIAFEARLRGAEVWILNRTVERAQELAEAIESCLGHCHSGGLDNFPAYYDILINCLPDPMVIDTLKILPGALVMDIVYVPRETPFLQEAARLGCRVVYGEEMFLNQAAAQRDFWLSDNKINLFSPV